MIVGTRQKASMLYAPLPKIRGVSTTGNGVRSPLMGAPNATSIPSCPAWHASTISSTSALFTVQLALRTASQGCPKAANQK
ncbi:hypothetical protein NDU88_003231 [Pleurodeles waltl]|uniref:Uncharacterized protein n=1 Tax=Pleurodeles waltl TaxID=8319 RepID=A0AAV7WR35_PLEWA|nr:hypothetical protein NDU88_003231 [Pleurodeles waltl]